MERPNRRPYRADTVSPHFTTVNVVFDWAMFVLYRSPTRVLMQRAGVNDWKN